jgi:hypothetical protein
MWNSRLMRLILSLLLCGLTAGPALADDASHVRQLGLEAARLRQLSYKPIASREVTQAQCGAYVRKLLLTDLKPGPTARREAFLRHLGLLHGPATLKQHYIKLLTSQVRGLYDPEKKVFLVVHGPAPSVLEWGLGLVSAAMGLKMEDVYTVHEMEHAVQDQHFHLQKLTKSVPDDFDRELAAQSLIEGDATVVMWQFACNLVATSPAEAAAKTAALCRYDMRAGQGFLATSLVPEGTPRFLQEVCNFPYAQGSAFVYFLARHGGWKAVDEAFRKLPQSTAEIFHPEEYGQVHFVPIKLTPLRLDSSWRSMGKDTAGEFLIRLLATLNGYDPNSMSGWRGDRYEVYARKSGTLVSWESQWENAARASYFSEIAVHALSEGKPVVSKQPGLWTWTNHGLLSRCQCEGTRVRMLLDSP